MATTLTVSAIRAGFQWVFANAVTGFDSPQVSTSITNGTTTLAQGTAANQADLVYFIQTTIAASGTLNIDLAGSLLDAFGNTITMARVKGIYIENSTATSATALTVGNGTNPFINWVGSGAHTISVRNGGHFQLVAPDATAYAVTAGTGDILKIVNADGSNTATVKIVIIGASA